MSRWHLSVVAWACVVLLSVAAFARDEAVSAGPFHRAPSIPSATSVIVDRSPQLQGDDLIYVENCDGSFENGYCWDGRAINDPYHGAFAEAYGGPAHLRGMRLYLTYTTSCNPGDSDLFVWGSGVGTPGAVLALVTGVETLNIPYWPEFGAYEFDLDVEVGEPQRCINATPLMRRTDTVRYLFAQLDWHSSSVPTRHWDAPSGLHAG